MGGKATALARRRACLALACLALAVCAGAPLAADDPPQCEAGGGDARLAVIYDLGGKFDRSFNQAAYDGAERFRRETGSAYLEGEIAAPGKREEAVRAMAQAGATAIVALGFAQTEAVAAVARDWPHTGFVLIDGELDLPNVLSVAFKEHEGAFLAGMAAALASQSGRVGFIGGMDVPAVRNYGAGYRQGARHVNPEISILSATVGSDASAWNDPERAAALARDQFAAGADVVFAAAGGSGLGVYRAAAAAGKLAIGVDSNQNRLHPGTMLTSAIKRVDEAVYRAFMAAWRGCFSGGRQLLGLAEGGVDWALDRYNRPLIAPAMEARIERARADIVAGRIAVQAAPR